MNYKKKLTVITIVFFVNYLLDRLTKVLAVNYLQGKEYHYLGDLIILTYVENKGAFLGAGADLSDFLRPLLLIVIPVIALTAGVVYCIFYEKDKYSLILITTIIAGGFANIQDRIFNDGKVTDFLNFGIGNLRTGVLNVADMSITFGAILLLIYEIFKSSNKITEG